MKGTICLTFDFDALSIWIQRNMTTSTSISRGEYGVVVTPRILHMLKQRNIKSTWFIPAHTVEMYPDVCELILMDGHEIALHGYTHENLNMLNAEEEAEILEKSYRILNEFSGEKPKGFRSPLWDISSRTIKNLERIGVEYDSSQMGNDYSPYFSRVDDVFWKDKPANLGKLTKLVEIPVSWSLDDYPYFEYLKTPTALIPGLQHPDQVFDNWMSDVNYMLRDFEKGILVATVHPQISGRGHRFVGLEKWVDGLLDKGLKFDRMDNIAQKFSDGYLFGQYKP